MRVAHSERLRVQGARLKGQSLKVEGSEGKENQLAVGGG